MKWSWTLGTIAGTKVRIHITFPLLLMWFAAEFWSLAGPRAALIGVVYFLAVFLCVLLHEFGHALAARRYGIRTPDITLYPIGGIARLERMPEKPKQELVVAAAGPAVNLVIAGILFLFLGQVPPSNLLISFENLDLNGFLGRMMLVNLVLVVFNLIPAFPMDGGRILRALLSFTYPRPKATRWAATIGQTLAVLGALFAIMFNLWLLLIVAAFIFFAAGQEASMLETRASFEGVPVGAAMETRFQTLHGNDSLEQAATALLESAQQDFPVVDENGKCTGLLLRTDLMRALANGNRSVSISEIAQRDFPVLNAGQPLVEALDSLRVSNLPAAPVFESGGEIEGLLTRENVAEFLTMRIALKKFNGQGA